MKSALKQYQATLEQIRQEGTYKNERIITTPQRSRIDTTAAKRVVNMCANNYLGLSDRPELIEAAKASYDQWGFGLSSVRFICGTQAIHKELEQKLSEFLGMEDAILYSSCFDANGGLFETLLGPEDAVISDELNHASIIDGVRLCKAKRYRYKNNDMDDLRRQLQDAFLAAGVVGMIIDEHASLAGAQGGCQAECGSAAAMAAAAVVQLMGGSPAQCFHAGAIAIKNMLGLVCDPVAGLVEIPCIKRNAGGVLQALGAADLALSGVESYIPFDDTVEAMNRVGNAMPAALRETALGGLATTASGKEMRERIYGA